jgi:hypothetical protein
MKEVTAVFQSEIFRPIVTLIVPGFFAISTLAIGVWQRHPNIERLAEQHSGLAATTALLVILTCGLVSEDLGASGTVLRSKSRERSWVRAAS